MSAGRFALSLAFLALMIPLLGSNALANKSAVSLQAPSTVQRGSEVTIQVKVTHEGNSFLHYTEWVYVMANGKVIARWQYTASARPEGDAFTREGKTTATDNLEIKAEASCNLHGSAGPATTVIMVKD